MFYLFLADIVVAVHLAYIAYVVVGELVILIGIALRLQWIRNFWFRISHLICILIVAVEELLRIDCPLTVWQKALLRAAGQETDSRSFVGHILDAVVFPGGIMENDLIAGLIHVGFALLVVLTFVVAPPRYRRGARAEAREHA